MLRCEYVREMYEFRNNIQTSATRMRVRHTRSISNEVDHRGDLVSLLLRLIHADVGVEVYALPRAVVPGVAIDVAGSESWSYRAPTNSLQRSVRDVYACSRLTGGRSSRSSPGSGILESKCGWTKRPSNLAAASDCGCFARS